MARMGIGNRISNMGKWELLQTLEKKKSGVDGEIIKKALLNELR